MPHWPRSPPSGPAGCVVIYGGCATVNTAGGALVSATGPPASPSPCNSPRSPRLSGNSVSVDPSGPPTCSRSLPLISHRAGSRVVATAKIHAASHLGRLAGRLRRLSRIHCPCGKDVTFTTGEVRTQTRFVQRHRRQLRSPPRPVVRPRHAHTADWTRRPDQIAVGVKTHRPIPAGVHRLRRHRQGPRARRRPSPAAGVGDRHRRRKRPARVVVNTKSSAAIALNVVSPVPWEANCTLAIPAPPAQIKHLRPHVAVAPDRPLPASAHSTPAASYAVAFHAGWLTNGLASNSGRVNPKLVSDGAKFTV